MVDSRLRIRLSDLTVEQTDELKRAFTHVNPAHAKLARINKWAAKKEPKFIATWILDRHAGELTIPRGGARRVREILKATGSTWEFDDQRVTGGERWDAEHAVTLWDFQREVVDAAALKQNCLVRSGTGSGKTTAAIALAARMGLPTLVVVWTGTLFDQWISRLRTELGMSDADIGRIRSGDRRVGKVTVGMLQTLKNCGDEYTNTFGMIIADEVHRFAAPSFMSVIDRSPAKYRIGVSDDERRKDGKEFLIYDVFGDVAANVDRAMLIDEGIVKDVAIDVIPTEFAREWYTDTPGPQRQQVHGQLLDEMGVDDDRNRIVVDVAERYARDHATFVFCHRREHCHRIEHMLHARGVKVGLMIGGAEYKSRFVATLAGMRSGELRVAVGTYQAIGTGLDVPKAARGVCATPIHSDQYGFRQVRGRLCRTADGKDDAVIAVLWDRGIFPRSPLANMVRWNRNVRVVQGNQVEDGKAVLLRLDTEDD